MVPPLVLRDGPLEKLLGGGGGGGRVQKNIRAGKINEKKFMRQPINPKKYSCYDLKKFIQGICYPQKIPAARKFPTPPKTFLMVRT